MNMACLKRILIAAVAAVGFVSFGETYLWSGAASTAFSTAGNWLVGGAAATAAPGAADEVVIDAAEIANKPSITAAASVGKLTIASGKLTLSAPLTVNGDFSIADGARLEGAPIDVTVNGDFDFAEGAVISVSTSGGVSTGTPRVNYEGGASHGGRGSRNVSLPMAAKAAEMYAAGEIAPCYGNVREPWETGSNGNGAGSGGGKGRFIVAGATHFNGKMYATGGGGDSRCASGGSLILTTGTIDGKGYMQVKGGKTNGRWGLGGAGRIAVTLTEAGATFDDFTGNFGAFGTDGTVSTGDTSQNDVLPNATRRTVAGAGTVYLRAGGEAIDEGAMIVDNCRDDWATAGKIDWEQSVTELNVTMPDRVFGKVIVRRGAKLELMPGVDVETSVWSNGSRVVCAPTSTVRIKGDRNGEAWIWGSTDFGSLVILPSVKTLHVEAGSVQKVVTKFAASGIADDDKTAICSTEDGVAFSLDVAADALQDLSYLSLKDCVAVGATLSAQFSSAVSGVTGWTFTEIPVGQEITWLGGASSVWGEAANWRDAGGANRTPLSTDAIVIPAGAAHQPKLPTTAMSLYSLSVASGATLFVNGSELSVQGLATIRGTLAVDANETIIFAGGADLAGATFTPVESTVKVANAAAASFGFGELSFNRFVFANTAAATVTGGFKTTEMTVEPGSEIRFAQDVAVTAAKLVAPGTAANPILFKPAVEGGTYVFTLTADAAISHLQVAGADSSAGMTVYALDGSEATDANVVNWKFADTRFVWTGASSTTFSAAGNWLVAGAVPAAAPGADDDVVIDAANLSRKPTVTANLSVGSILMKSGTLTFNNTVSGTLARSLVMQNGATVTIGRPLVIGGSMLMEDGSKLNGIGGTDYYIDVTVGGDFDFREGATVSAGQGGVTTGKPTVDKEAGASHGGRGSRNYDLPSAATIAKAYQDGEIAPCYGNVREPWEYGTTFYGAGGGKARFTVAGATHFNGKMYATGGGADSRCASGGSLILTAGTIDGKGYMQVKGGKTNGRRGLGGAGRIAVTLTEQGATFGNFVGNFGAYGADGTVSTGDTSQNEVLPVTSRRTVSGAGTVYLRVGGEAIDEGAAIIDNCRDDWATVGKVDWEMSITEFNTAMPDLDFGKLIVRRGGKLVLMPGVEVETSVWSNGCKVICDPSSTVKIKGDRNGEAWIFGDTTFGNLTVLPSVKTLHIEAGSVQAVATKLTAKGVSADELMLLRSTAPGTAYSLDVSADAATDLEFLGVADAQSIGAKLAPQRSRDDSGNNEEGWDFTTIEPGMVITWNGAESSAWGLADNWTDAEGNIRAPIATDRVVVPAWTPNAPVMPVATVTVMDLTVAAGATLNLNGATLMVTGDITAQGKLVAAASEALTFGGNVVFASGSFAASDSTVTLAPATAATANFGGCEFNRFVFAAAKETLVTGGFTAAELMFEAGAKAAFAQGVAVTATKLDIAGTVQDNVILKPQTAGGTWKLTVKGYSTVAGVTVGGADSSEGMAIYASGATFSDGNNVNWNLGDSRYHWTGAVDADFAKPGNWLVGEGVPETAPGEDDEIVVDSIAQTMTVSSEGVKVKGLTLTAGAVKFSKGVEIAGSMVMLGGTSATIDAPTKIGGSFLMFDGSTLTHSAQGGGVLKYWIELDVGGDAVFESGSKIKLDANGYANETGPGNGKASTSGASYGGQGGCQTNVAGVGWVTCLDPYRGRCYGSIFSVTNCGSGGRYYGAIGGGLFILHADAGTVTFDGIVDASPKYVDNCASSGGGVWITAGRFRGAGEINCDGGQNNNATAGGGGRISVILREPGATFGGCNVNMHAFGGWHGNGNSGYRSGAAGTIYLQTGDEQDGHGVIRMVNHPSVGYITYTLLGYDGCDDLRHARLEIGRNVRVGVLTQSTDGQPLKIRDFTLTDTTAKLDLCGNTLRVRSVWHEYPTGQVLDAGELAGGKKPNWTNILWNTAGLSLFLK